jgi:hypothetical protein
MARVVRMSGQNRQRSIDLFRCHYASQLMWQGDSAEREQQVRPLQRGSRPTIRRPHCHHHPLASSIAQVAEARGNFLRRELLATAVEQDYVCGSSSRLLRQPVQKSSLVVEGLGLTRQIADAALYIVGKQAIGSFGFRSGTSRRDCSQKNLHEIVIQPRATSLRISP